MSKSMKRFVVVVRAAAEIQMQAQTAADALRQYQQRLARSPRLRGKGVVVQLLADKPAVLDLETGQVVAGSRRAKKRTPRQLWNAPTAQQIAEAQTIS